MEDVRQNRLWLKYCKNKGYEVVKIPTRKKDVAIFGVVMPISIFGLKMLKIQRSEIDPDWDELRKIRREKRVVSSIIEPSKAQSISEYQKNGYKLSNFPYLATKTVVVDLKRSEKEMWKSLSENTKRLVVKNNKITVKEVSPKVFLDYWKKSSKVWTLKLSELESIKKTLGKNAKFFVSYASGQAQSGILLIETKDTANYMHTFTTKEGRKSGAHFALVWKVILQEKAQGLSWFDFEGIYDQRWPQKRWLGFTEFKKKFGGKVITYPGCFHKWF